MALRFSLSLSLNEEIFGDFDVLDIITPLVFSGVALDRSISQSPD